MGWWHWKNNRGNITFLWFIQKKSVKGNKERRGQGTDGVSSKQIARWRHKFSHISLNYCCCCSVAKSCSALCSPMGYRMPGPSVHGVFQARTLEWIAISFSRGSSWTKDWTHVSCVGRQILHHWATRGDH